MNRVGKELLMLYVRQTIMRAKDVLDACDKYGVPDGDPVREAAMGSIAEFEPALAHLESVAVEGQAPS